MHPKDLALIWERWQQGETLFALATAFGVSVSQLHQDLQGFLEQKDLAKQVWVGAA